MEGQVVEPTSLVEVPYRRSLSGVWVHPIQGRTVCEPQRFLCGIEFESRRVHIGQPEIDGLSCRTGLPVHLEEFPSFPVLWSGRLGRW